jgi:hypothetical protein
LRFARSEFAGDEIVLRNKERLEAGRWVKHSFHAPLLCGVEIDPRKVRENIEAAGIASKTKEELAAGLVSL